MNIRRPFVFVLLSSFAACGRTEDNQGDAAGGADSVVRGGAGAGGSHTDGGAKITMGGWITSDGGFSNFNGGTGAVGNGGDGHGGSGHGGAGNGGSNTDGGKTSGGSIGEGASGGELDHWGPPVPLTDGSWDVSVLLWAESNPSFGVVNCPSTSFTMHLTAQGATLTALLGRDGYISEGKLVDSEGTATYELQGQLGIPTKGSCSLSSLSISELSLRGFSDDGDRFANVIQGGGKASGVLIQGDVGETVLFRFGLDGGADVRPPGFASRAVQHPLDAVSLATSEPVTATSTVTLSNGNVSVALVGTGSHGVFGTFDSPAILPFGSSFDVTATGADLAGLPFASNLAPVTTLPDPGIFVQDGFESAPQATLTGGAKFVSAVGSLAALSGSQSLFVPPSSSATFHLTRASGASTVRFSVQSLSVANGATGFPPSVQVGVIGGSVRVSPSISYGTTTIATGDSTWGYAAAKQEASVALTESGSDVVVRIQVPNCNGLCPPSQAVLIDNLRIE